MQTMGCQQLMPSHNSSSNRLHPGLMQQAPHSCLVVDECISTLSPALQEHDAWCSRNMRAMHDYMKDGMLTANYMWQQVRLPASGSVLVVSDEPSSFSESCRICISATSAPEKTAASVDPSSHPLQGIRCYLACAWDLWEGLEYEHQEGGYNGRHPRWVAETLVARGKQVAAAVNRAGASTCNTTKAYETAVMLLHCLSISQGKNVISRSDWGAVDRVVASCQARCGSGLGTSVGNAGLQLKQQEQGAAPVPLQELRVQPSTDHDMHIDSGDQVLRERQPQQEVSAGQAMIDALRRTGAL
jgi:Mini-chromosome maintenance replisome factor